MILQLLIFVISRASYRNLLGTAESIIEMDDQMHDVEALIGNIAQKCNTRLLERKMLNLKAWRQEAGAKGTICTCMKSFFGAYG